jgi:hypothetical protein
VYDGFTCETCGGAWFRVLVSLDPEGRVTGNDIKGTCKDCGEPAAFPIPPEVY